MKKLRFFVVLFMVLCFLLAALPVSIVSAQSPVVPADKTAALQWPCGSLKTPGKTDIDYFNVINLKSLGSFPRTFQGTLGSCYAGRVKGWEKSYNVTGGTRIDIRIASGELRKVFLTTQFALKTYGGGGANIISTFKLYVPDALVEKYKLLGFTPIPFSQVTDWSYENMLGASNTDTEPQWIKKGVEMGNYKANPLYLKILVYSLAPSAKGVSVYFTWRPAK